MRDKENENDYRYFPDPDLLPIQVTRFQIAEIKQNMPQLPEQIKHELSAIDTLNDEDTSFILSSPAAYQFYRAVKQNGVSSDKLIINWLKGQYSALLNEHNQSFEIPPVSALLMAQLLAKIEDKSISSNNAKNVFHLLWAGEHDIEEIINREGYQQSNDSGALEELISTVVQNNPTQAADYRAGKEKLLAFFVGQIMKQTKGQADPELVNSLLKKHLS
ncbi:MAG: Asp-tRNA(Asn)/Glu-tRNA(Gln) amidotransferase subunit GatB, partial [Legionella sp.]